MDILDITLSIIAILSGIGLGLLISKKTKWLDNFNKKSKDKNKIINDPGLLKEKIEETLKKMNPHATGDSRIVDDGKEIIFEVKEKDGKEYLDVSKKDIILPKKPKEVKNPKKVQGKTNKAKAPNNSKAS